MEHKNHHITYSQETNNENPSEKTDHRVAVRKEELVHGNETGQTNNGHIRKASM